VGGVKTRKVSYLEKVLPKETMSLETSAPSQTKRSLNRYAPIEEHNSAMAINLRTISVDAATEVRNRMISEYNNTALVSALFLTMTFPVLIAPPEFDVDKDSLRFRVFMYSCAISVSTLSFATLMSVSLSYNLNMMPTEKELGEFIRKISQLGPGLSENGLPDHLIVAVSIGMTSAIVMCITALHITMNSTDAWVITIIMICLVVIPVTILTKLIDIWKWNLLSSVSSVSKSA
jgi:hypothetical protein